MRKTPSPHVGSRTCASGWSPIAKSATHCAIARGVKNAPRALREDRLSAADFAMAANLLVAAASQDWARRWLLSKRVNLSRSNGGKLAQVVDEALPPRTASGLAQLLTR